MENQKKEINQRGEKFDAMVNYIIEKGDEQNVPVTRDQIIHILWHADCAKESYLKGKI